MAANRNRPLTLTTLASPASSAATVQRLRIVASQLVVANARNNASLYPAARKIAAGETTRYKAALRPEPGW
jgi:hypothetical protein